MSDNHAAPKGRLRERAAEEIRVILARRKMSAAELARRTGLKQPYISRRMTGETAFDLDDLEVIARELNISVTELLGGSSGKGVQDTSQKLSVTNVQPPMPDRTMPDRPRDNRPSGRPSRTAPNPTTRRPVRL